MIQKKRLTALERRRNVLVGVIRRMPEGPSKQRSRRRLLTLTYGVVLERGGL